MGYTPGLLRGEQKCPGRSVTRWMNGSSSSPGCWMGRRWRCYPSVRYLAQDRLQDPHALQRNRSGRAYRPLAPALPPREPAALPDRDADRALEAGQAELGGAEDQGKLARLYPDVHTPAISTVHAVLDRHGLVKRRMGRRNRAKGTALSRPGQPNDLWCADYKGEFMLADRRYCYPLTLNH